VYVRAGIGRPAEPRNLERVPRPPFSFEDADYRGSAMSRHAKEDPVQAILDEDPVQAILDAIAALPAYPEGFKAMRLAEALASIAGIHPDSIRRAPPGSFLSRMYAFMYELQNKLLGMTPDDFDPEKPVSLVGERLRRQTQRMAPVVAKLKKGHETANNIKRKPTFSAAHITELKARKRLTWEEVDSELGVAPGTSRAIVYRDKKRRQN
jgi:hypothetical protein